MKALVLIIVSVALTVFLINGYNSFTGTRATSDNRADNRTKSEQYDNLALENAKQDNTVKTQAKSMKDLKTDSEVLKLKLAVSIALNNADSEINGKLERSLIASQTLLQRSKEKHAKTTRLYSSLIIKHNKLVARWNNKYKSKVTTSNVSKSKIARQKSNSLKMAELYKKKAVIVKSYSKLEKNYKYASQSVGGSSGSKKRKAKKLKLMKSKMSLYVRSIKKIDKDIGKLKRR